MATRDFIGLAITPLYIDAEDMVGGAVDGDPIYCGKIQHLAFHIIWSGTPTGTITLEVSNDGVNWVDVTSGLSPIFGDANPVGAAGAQFFVVRNLGLYVRLRYAGAGAGALTAIVHPKDI